MEYSLRKKAAEQDGYVVQNCPQLVAIPTIPTSSQL